MSKLYNKIDNLDLTSILSENEALDKLKESEGKYCKNCFNMFEGEGDLCPDCKASLTEVSDVERSAIEAVKEIDDRLAIKGIYDITELSYEEQKEIIADVLEEYFRGWDEELVRAICSEMGLNTEKILDGSIENEAGVDLNLGAKVDIPDDLASAAGMALLASEEDEKDDESEEKLDEKDSEDDSIDPTEGKDDKKDDEEKEDDPQILIDDLQKRISELKAGLDGLDKLEEVSDDTTFEACGEEFTKSSAKSEISKLEKELESLSKDKNKDLDNAFGETDLREEDETLDESLMTTTTVDNIDQESRDKATIEKAKELVDNATTITNDQFRDLRYKLANKDYDVLDRLKDYALVRGEDVIYTWLRAEDSKNNLKEAEILVTNINWETDGSDVDLPKDTTIPVEKLDIEDISDDEKVQEALNNYLSDNYGYLVNNYSYELKESVDISIVDNNINITKDDVNINVTTNEIPAEPTEPAVELGQELPAQEEPVEEIPAEELPEEPTEEPVEEAEEVDEPVIIKEGVMIGDEEISLEDLQALLDSNELTGKDWEDKLYNIYFSDDIWDELDANSDQVVSSDRMKELLRNELETNTYNKKSANLDNLSQILGVEAKVEEAEELDEIGPLAAGLLGAGAGAIIGNLATSAATKDENESEEVTEDALQVSDIPAKVDHKRIELAKLESEDKVTYRVSYLKEDDEEIAGWDIEADSDEDAVEALNKFSDADTIADELLSAEFISTGIDGISSLNYKNTNILLSTDDNENIITINQDNADPVILKGETFDEVMNQLIYWFIMNLDSAEEENTEEVPTEEPVENNTEKEGE